MLLEGKTAIVTGAASERGIGFATARLFAAQGARVALLDRETAAPHSFAARLGTAHLGLACDVADGDACRRTVAAVGERFMIRRIGRERPALEDPGLAADVEAFLAQESLHVEAHAPFNRLLLDALYPACGALRRASRRMLGAAERLPRVAGLAVCAAFASCTMQSAACAKSAAALT